MSDTKVTINTEILPKAAVANDSLRGFTLVAEVEESRAGAQAGTGAGVGVRAGAA